MKKVLSIILAAIMLFAFPMGTLALDSTAGKYGDLDWHFSGYPGEVYFEGTGDMYGSSPFAGDKSIITVDVRSGNNVSISAFQGCPNLGQVLMPTVKVIGSYAFADCKALHQVNAENVKTIDAMAFSGCTDLTYICLSASLTTVNPYAFGSCNKLKTVYFKGNNTEWTNLKAALGEGNDAIKNATVVLNWDGKFTCEHAMTEETIIPTVNGGGLSEEYCKYCGENYTQADIPGPKKYVLSKNSYVYDGKAKKPSVKVYNEDGYVISSKYYTLKYKNNVKVGTAYVYVVFDGKHIEGTKKVAFKIVPKAAAINKVTSPKKKQLKVTWKKQTVQTTGYQVQYSLNKNFKKAKKVTVKGNKNTFKIIKKLKSKKRYYARVRTYKTVDGKNYYSSWSKAKYVKVK